MFQTEEAICIVVLRGNLLTILVDIASNSGYEYSGISNTVNLLSSGLLSRSLLFDVTSKYHDVSSYSVCISHLRACELASFHHNAKCTGILM